MADGADSVGGASAGALEEVRSAMVGLVNDPRARPRERVAAARVILSAVRLVRDVAELRAAFAGRDGIGEMPLGGGGEGVPSAGVAAVG